MNRRTSAVPRSIYPLLILLVLSALWMWRGGDDGEPSGPRLLFGGAEETIVSCVVRGEDTEVILTRDPEAPNGWRLDGDLTDLADADGVVGLLADLTESLGTEPVADAGWASLSEDYGLDGRGLFEVLVVDADGDRRTLRIGARNPASGLFYATGAGRESLYMVGEDLVGILAALPASVRARELWPGFARDDADTVRLRFSGHEGWDLAVKDDAGRWWLRRPTDGWARTGQVARDYHRHHADRRRTEAGVEWLRLRDREVDGLLSYLESDRVRDFLSPDIAAPTDGFAVRVSGAGHRPHEVIYGELETENRVPAWRDGHPGLVLPAEVVKECSGGLPQYLHTDALTHRLAAADSFALTRADLGRVSFVDTTDGWRLSMPPAPDDRERLELMGLDLAFFLDHLVIRRVFDPTDADPLGPPMTTLTVWATGPDTPPRTEVRIGLATDANIPAAWFPADGRFIEVDRDILITLQTVLMTAVGMKR